MKIITFAAGNPSFLNMAKNLKNSASEYETTIYTERFLKNHADFWSHHKEFITKNLCGFGYWVLDMEAFCNTTSNEYYAKR